MGGLRDTYQKPCRSEAADIGGMKMTDENEIQWPREIWMAERDEYDQGVVQAVLPEHATIARWQGDTERDREFHRYVDGDIYDSAEKYWWSRADLAPSWQPI